MSTGWKYIRDDGEEYKSKLLAVYSLKERPESTFIFSELDMSGTTQTDVTEEIKQLYEEIKQFYKINTSR